MTREMVIVERRLARILRTLLRIEIHHERYFLNVSINSRLKFTKLLS